MTTPEPVSYLSAVQACPERGCPCWLGKPRPLACKGVAAVLARRAAKGAT